MRFILNANDGIYSMLSPQMSSKLTHMTLENNWKSVWLLSLGADIKSQQSVDYSRRYRF